MDGKSTENVTLNTIGKGITIACYTQDGSGYTGTSGAIDVQSPVNLEGAVILPLNIVLREKFTVTMRVTNNGQALAKDVTPFELETHSSARVTKISGPTPPKANIPGGSSQDFTWIYRADKVGTINFSGSVSGKDGNTGASISSLTSSSANLLTIQAYENAVKTMNYPNPFDPDEKDTTIQYYLNEEADVEIKIYTIGGELVNSWEISSGSEYANKQINAFPWNGRNGKGRIVENGIYVCSIEKKYSSGLKRDIIKIAVLR